MIESNVIEWIDFGDSAQYLDIYSKKKLYHYLEFLEFYLKINIIQ